MGRNHPVNFLIGCVCESRKNLVPDMHKRAQSLTNSIGVHAFQLKAGCGAVKINQVNANPPQSEETSSSIALFGVKEPVRISRK